MSVGQCPLCGFAGTPGEMFEHVARGSWREHGSWSAAQAVAKGIGLDYRGGFADASGSFNFGGLEVVVRPAVTGRTRRDKSSAHRIMLRCPHDGRLVPVGRVHQHLPVHGSGRAAPLGRRPRS